MTRAQAVRVTMEEVTRRRLERVASSAKAEAHAVVRARIVLAAATSAANETIAQNMRVSVNTVASGVAGSLAGAWTG